MWEFIEYITNTLRTRVCGTYYFCSKKTTQKNVAPMHTRSRSKASMIQPLLASGWLVTVSQVHLP